MSTLMIDLLQQTVREVHDYGVAFPVLDFQARPKYLTAPQNAPLAELLELYVKEKAAYDPKERMLFAREVKYGLDRVEDWCISTKFANIQVWACRCVHLEVLKEIEQAQY
jgi:hypothetical protein